jgi:cytosine/creatinine deaminase
VGTTRADTFVDVTPDNIRMQALERLLAIREERRGEIDFRLGAYSPMGYRDDDPGRWELLIEGAGRAQFLGCLPEADDHADYPEHIGFQEHCRRMLQLGQELGLEVHVHVDQRNEPSEKGTELLLDALDEVGQPGSAEGPGVWAVHVISPSTYDEPRFQRMLERLVEHDVGIIVSPSAALGMRQLRPLQGPTFNSIARVMDFLEAGLLVRLGSDNMADICSPSTTADLVDEVFVLSAALRFYHVETLARVAAGQRLAPEELEFVKRHQEHDRREVERTIPILCERS